MNALTRIVLTAASGFLVVFLLFVSLTH